MAPPTEAEGRLVPIPTGDTSSNFVKNHLWPTVCGLGFALLVSVTEAPALFEGGIDADEWPILVKAILAAGSGYLANVMTRYGGKKTGWTNPVIRVK